MISSTLGAPFGGTMVGGHHGLESLEFSLITPPNLGSGAGICFPSIVVVALGEPGVPVVCWAIAPEAPSRRLNERMLVILIMPTSNIGPLSRLNHDARHR